MTRNCLVLIVLAAATLRCGRTTEAGKQEPPPPMIVGPEDVVQVERGQVITGAILSGELDAKERATIRAQLTGSLVEVRAREGDRVQKGDVLARIRAVSEREAVGSAQAAVETAKTQLRVAQRDQDRTAVLVKAGALAERDLDQAQAATDAAQAQVAEAEARLASAREQFRDSVVRASINGVISEAMVDGGDVVSAGAELFTIVNPATLELHASVPAENLAQIRRGAPVRFTVQGYPERTFRGQISRIVPAADPVTRQVDVYASVGNDSGILVAGLYAEGRIATGGANVLTLPTSAVLSGPQGDYVLQLKDQQAVRTAVKIGERDERTGRLQVLSGLADGDTVLTGAAASEVRPGASVELRRTSQPSKQERP